MKSLFILGSLLILTSCAGGASQYQLNSAMKKAETEAFNCPMQSVPSEVASAWERVIKLDGQECPRGTDTKPLDPSLAMKRYECYSGLVRKHVKPVSKSPKNLEKFLATVKENGISYSKGILNRKEANDLTDQNFNKYMINEVSYFKMAQCENASMQKNVMPVYPHKGLLADLMAKKLEIGLSVDEKKMSPAQAQIEMQKLFARLVSNEQVMNSAMQQQN
jgi:hypothetical protein